MTNEAPRGAPGPEPKNRTNHYLALIAVVVLLGAIFAVTR